LMQPARASSKVNLTSQSIVRLVGPGPSVAESPLQASLSSSR
jgi:hypothetical protein